MDNYNVRANAEAVIHAGAIARGDDVVLATDRILPTQLAVDDEQVYCGGGGYADGPGTAIKAVDKHGGTPRIVALVEAANNDRFDRYTCQGGVICPYRFAVDATDIFYGPNNTLRRIDKRRPDSVPVELATGRIASIAVDTTHVYWVDCSDDAGAAVLKKLTKSGGAPTELAKVDAGFNCMTMSNRLVLDDTTAYFALQTNVYSMPKNGGTATAIDTGGHYVSSLAVTGSDLYWVTSGADAGRAFANSGHHSLVRAPKRGGAFVELTPPRDDHSGHNDGSCDALDVTVDDKNLYWVVMGGVLTRPLQSGVQ